MNWNAIITRSQYENTLKRVAEIRDELPGTPAGDELLLLMILIRDYEKRHADKTERMPVYRLLS